MYYDLMFYVFAALSVLSAIVVVFSRSVIYAAFSLVFTFLGVVGAGIMVVGFLFNAVL